MPWRVGHGGPRRSLARPTKAYQGLAGGREGGRLSCTLALACWPRPGLPQGVNTLQPRTKIQTRKLTGRQTNKQANKKSHMDTEVYIAHTFLSQRSQHKPTNQPVCSTISVCPPFTCLSSFLPPPPPPPPYPCAPSPPPPDLGTGRFPPPGVRHTSWPGTVIPKPSSSSFSSSSFSSSFSYSMLLPILPHLPSMGSDTPAGPVPLS